jgi:VanZ family protein
MWRAVFWFAVVAGTVLAMWPHPLPEQPWFAGSDKVEHALSFALLVSIGQRADYRNATLLAIGLLALGGAIEIAQGLFTTTRTAEWFDWFADALGIALGFVIERAVQRARTAASTRLEQKHGR